ncbi:hypothetical protein BDY17DRAFT_147654 [Neohortaea acidophila]|uniref:Uncharacterized protein n=1 Tax=Neohortaea acidophila TaxID=245834 RepID=A0A6A6PUJ8_9PEZI|nr:uncharacterized protein BDY17DRAFT_147654 [Neohortaea acidophila]KAF2483446.1 hypothetical protein BDY17DRAFT_147654 [Neohortaea acidophila]
MQSPLPDSRALEAGIIPDEPPSRLSRVQENVRNLLRNPTFVLASTLHSGSVAAEPERQPSHRHDQHMPAVPVPLHHVSRTERARVEVPPASIPPSHDQRGVLRTVAQSTLFNSRAFAALDHPDLSDPSLFQHLRKTHHRHRHSWKRSRRSKHSSGKSRASSSRCLCVLTALLLGAVVATCEFVPTELCLRQIKC